MRLYAYVDRFDCDRFGVVVADDHFLTGRQLERFGGLPTLSTHMGIANEIRFDKRWQRRLQRAVERCLRKGVEPKPLASRRPAAAIVPGKIVCVGLNYRDHLAEQGIDRPARPLLFAKFGRHRRRRRADRPARGDARPRPRGRARGRHRAACAARRGRGGDDHVAGYVVVNDVSARDWQGIKAALAPGEHGDGQWLRAKGSDTFLPVGPMFVTADEVDGPPDLPLRSWRIPGAGPDAGRRLPMQDDRTADIVCASRSSSSSSARASPSSRATSSRPAPVGRRGLPRPAGLPRAG